MRSSTLLPLLLLVAALARPGSAQTYFDVPAAYPTIQAALNAATPGGIVRIAAGTYTGAGNTDLDPLGKSITIRGAGSSATLIDCQGTPASPRRGFTITSGGTALVIEHLGIANGHAARGAAMDIQNARPTVRDCRFAACTATADGGAVFVDGVAPVRFTSCTFEQCVANHGGAVFARSVMPVVLLQCTFQANTAFFAGGAVLADSMPVTIDTCTFSGNTCAQAGGAVRAWSTAPLTIRASTFTGNAAGDDGGAVRIENFATATITTSTFSNNTAGPPIAQPGGGSGGAICVSDGQATITDCVLQDNRGRVFGGAVYLGASPGARVERCQFLRNQTGDSGGGLIADHTITIDDCIFQDNWTHGGVGAAVFLYTNSCVFSMRGGRLRSNSSSAGGALDVAFGAHGSVEHVTLEANQTPSGNGAWGAAVRVREPGTNVAFLGCAFRNNVADGVGAIVVDSGATALFDDCEIRGNHARSGWGSLHTNRGATATWRRCRIVDNTSAGWTAVMSCEHSVASFEGCQITGNGAVGDGVFVSGPGGDLRLHACTIADNASNAHALIADVGQITLTNSIVWGNFRWPYRTASGGTLTASWCDFEGGIPGLGNLNVDPQFVNPFGGDYHLSQLSPVRDAGNTSLVPPALLTDLDGNPRLWGSAVDLGADEFAPLWPGTADSLQLVTLVNGASGALTIKSAAAGDRLEVRVSSAPSLFGAIGLAIANLAPVGTPIVPTPGLPGLQIDLASIVVLAGGFAPAPFGWEYLGPVPIQRTFTVPTGLAGSRLRVQAVALGPQTQNGFIGCSEAQEITF